MSVRKILSLIVALLFIATESNAQSVQEYSVKVGETVKLEISSTGRSILSKSTGKQGKWDVNPTQLQIISSSWDYAIVKGLKATSLSSVQLTVTHNHNGIYNDKYYAAFHVRIYEDPKPTVVYPTGVSLSKSYLDITAGDNSYSLNATVTPSNATDKSVTWKSSDTSVAQVNSSGRITAVSPGSCEITATTSNGIKSSPCYVTVLRKKPTSVSLTKSYIELNEGESDYIYASVIPYDADQSVTWQSSDTSVATVSNKGFITAISEGSCTITVKTVNNLTAKATVAVKALPKDLYLVGDNSLDSMEEYYKFSSEDAVEHIIYLDYLSGSFKLSDGKNNYGLDSEFIPGQTVSLTSNSEYLHVDGYYENVKLMFNTETRELKSEFAIRNNTDDLPKYKVYFTTEGNGALGQYVAEGRRLPLRFESQDGWILNGFYMDDYIFDNLYYDQRNDVYLTPPIKEECIIGPFYEIDDSAVDTISSENKAKLEITPGGIRLTDMPANVSADIYGVNGLLIAHIPPAGNVGHKDIPVSEHGVYLISLSNGQMFKVAR